MALEVIPIFLIGMAAVFLLGRWLGRESMLDELIEDEEN